MSRRFYAHLEDDFLNALYEQGASNGFLEFASQPDVVYKILRLATRLRRASLRPKKTAVQAKVPTLTVLPGRRRERAAI